MIRPVLLAAAALCAILGLSCTPLNSSGTERLLVDPGAPRYGRIIKHGSGTSVPIVRGDGIAELFVYVRVGTSRGWWQIDTGAAFSVVTTRIAKHEGFASLSAGEIMTAAGSVDSQLGTLPSVRLGDLEIRNVTALSLDEDFADDFKVQGERGFVIGVLGADLLDHLGATIDLRSNTLRLRP